MKVESFGPLEYADCGLCGSPDTALVVIQHLFREDFHVVRCTSCGLIRTNPRPSAEWKSRFYDPRCNSLPEMHGRDFLYAPEEDRLPAYRRLLRFLMEHMPSGRSLVDVGAASGVFVKMAVDAGLDAVACDYSPEALAYARANFGVRTLQSPAESIDAPDDSFDFVTMLHTIEHLADPVRALREMHRILAPGGTILLETPNYAFHHLAETRLRALFATYRIVTKREGLPWVPFDHYFHWTPALLRRALTVAGFQEPRSHHIMGYRSNTKPSRVFGAAFLAYDVSAQAVCLATRGRGDFRLVQLVTARK